MPRFHLTQDNLPAGPPPEVMREVEAAWKRAQVLSKTRLRLDFAVDTVANRVCVGRPRDARRHADAFGRISH